MKADNRTLLHALDGEAAATGRDARGCPPVSLAARLLADEATEAERMAFADHLLVCPDCVEEFKTAGPLEELAKRAALETGTRVPGGAVRTPVSSAPWLAWGAAAAALLVALGLATTWLLSRRQPEAAAVERGTAAPISAVSPPDRAVLAEPPRRLAWTPVEGAESYRVVLYDAESTPLWEATIGRESGAAVPEAVRGRLRSGGNFYWRVETRRRAQELTSDLHRFSLPALKPGG